MRSTSKKFVRGKIVERLRNDVLSGRIEPGQFLRQEKLVARFRVSRMPVREALMQLANEGLVEAVANCGVKVRESPPDHIQEFLTPLRRTIEVYALQLCFDSLGDDDFNRWDSMLKKLRRACQRRDIPSVTECELEFHRSIVERAGEPTLLGVWSVIAYQVAAYMREWHKKYTDPMDNYREHAKIVALFRAGDKQLAIKFYAEMIGAHHLIR
ncbi:MAG: GntR family transcriptional regulator [Pirellulales bacterium]|nr:GntR family transcriptional regulator [Pirellulales bacterium]